MAIMMFGMMNVAMMTGCSGFWFLKRRSSSKRKKKYHSGRGTKSVLAGLTGSPTSTRCQIARPTTIPIAIVAMTRSL
ncbi:hypothetical protein D3C83_230480 [compost metagenome]